MNFTCPNRSNSINRFDYLIHTGILTQEDIAQVDLREIDLEPFRVTFY